MSKEQRQRIDFYTSKHNSMKQGDLDIYVDGILLPVWEFEHLTDYSDGTDVIIRIQCKGPRRTYSYYLAAPGVAAPFLFMGRDAWYSTSDLEHATKYNSLHEARAALGVVKNLPQSFIGGIETDSIRIVRRTVFSHPFTGEDVGLSPEYKWMDEEDKPKKKDYRSPYNTPISEFVGVDDDDDDDDDDDEEYYDDGW